ncbi:MAG: hypothetical protein ACYTEL_20900 [Planctomycetota bacterium]|jgi:hypothetical protein
MTDDRGLKTIDWGLDLLFLDFGFAFRACCSILAGTPDKGLRFLRIGGLQLRDTLDEMRNTSL